MLFQFPNFCSSIKSCNFSGLLSLLSSYQACCSPLGNTAISAIDFAKTRFKCWFKCTYLWKLHTECFFFVIWSSPDRHSLGMFKSGFGRGSGTAWSKNALLLAQDSCFQKSSIMSCWEICFPRHQYESVISKDKPRCYWVFSLRKAK